jgi:hypothetical protein
MGIRYQNSHYLPWSASWVPVVVGLHIRYRFKHCSYLVIYRKDSSYNHSFQRRVGNFGQSFYLETLLVVLGP